MVIAARVLAALLVLAVGALPAADGPFAPTYPRTSPAAWSEPELEQLLAPIALYPDGLLAQVLAAATYPVEVIALHRWLERHPDLAGAALEEAAAMQPWDASVKALAGFRDVVAMMNGELEWMQRLGNAFLAAEADVMAAVQRLRRKAWEAGALRDGERERVVLEREVIVIEPAEPAVIHVPVYDPWVVYGVWGWPAHPPFAWRAYFGPFDFVAGGLAFGAGVRLWRPWADHPHFDWRGRQVVVRRPGHASQWRHDPARRGGFSYPDPSTRERYRPMDRGGVRQREDYRGFEVKPVHPAPTPRASWALPPAQPVVPPLQQPVPRLRQPVAPLRQPVQPLQRASPAPAHAAPPALAPAPHAARQSERGRESLGALRQPAKERR